MSKHTSFSHGDKIAIACDHGGYELKGTIIDTLKEYQFKGTGRRTAISKSPTVTYQGRKYLRKKILQKE